MSTGSSGALRSGTWRLGSGGGVARFRIAKLGVIRVSGSVPIADVSVFVEHGRPRIVRAELDATAVDTGIPRRDRALQGRRWLSTAEHPTFLFTAIDPLPSPDGWRMRGTLSVRGVSSDVELLVDDVAVDDDAARLRGSATIDRVHAGVRHAPRWAVGRRIEIALEVTLRLDEGRSA